MRETKRIGRICRLLAKKWKTQPDQRLGQFLSNYVFGHHSDDGACIFYQEDDQSEIALNIMGVKDEH